MKLRCIAEGTLSDVGHVALDVAGLVPLAGEPADLTNALWYAKKGDYLNAAFSLMSIVPELGDLVGKGAKYLGKGSKHVAAFITKHGPTISKYWDEVLKIVGKIEEWEPYIKEVTNALEGYLNQGVEDENANSPNA
jgi:hypothetical protein